MKNMRKIASILLALVMVIALAAPVYATNTSNADLTGHTYKAYQIFTGTQADASADLGNIEWGTGIDGTAFLAALKENGNKFNACNTAADVAGVVATFNDSSDEAKSFAKIAYSHIKGAGTECESGTTNLDAGYYLVVDVTDFKEGAENTVYNLALLQLTKKGTFEIANKTDVPEVEKKVKDTNDTTGDTTDWQDSADHDKGDHVPFQLTATLASNVSDYNTYKIVFHDTLSAGLTYDNNAVVTFNGTNVTDYFDITCESGKLTISCDDVKEFNATNSSKIVVEYTATLNENAIMGSTGNPNEVYLEYSNQPNYTGSGENIPTGDTPKDKVIVFTYKVIVDKVDENNQPLVGAGFTLYKREIVTPATETTEAVYNWVAIGEELTGDNMTQFVWERLDDGDYKLMETTTPDGYNTIADIYFTISAEHDILDDNPTLSKLEGGNLFTGDVSTGALTGQVMNQSGTQLPETGGVGTTMFYVFGAVMVLAAVVLLVTKKRMASAN